jgi:thioredoxin-related protein
MKTKMLFASFMLLVLWMPFSYAQNFLHNIDEAKKIAVEKDQAILMIFSGSDWCKPCIQLREKILTHTEFTAFSDENMVLLELDFPYKKKNRLSKEQQKHNEALAEKYNPKGAFPLMVLLDKSGKLIESYNYNKLLAPKDYVRLFELKSKNLK